ncbi:MAG TPA: phosphatase PAP2 family protein [Gaiellaceae bacterium]|nr:phosphatase PAP2 family protein [Gaiellaceae bacterium]
MALRERLLAAAPSRREWELIGALGAALVLLAILVVAGTLTRFDQFALDHLMPWLRPSAVSHNSSAGYWRPFPLGISTGAKLVDTLTYPCSLLISAIVVGAAALVFWRNGRHLTALGLGTAWAVGNAIEWAGKHTLTRSALYGTTDGVRIHVGSYDDSFPSGHMIRGIIVSYAAVLLLEGRWSWAIAVWAALVGPALVLQSAHTPTDVFGGALIGLILLVFMRAAARSELAPQRQRKL